MEGAYRSDAAKSLSACCYGGIHGECVALQGWDARPDSSAVVVLRRQVAFCRDDRDDHGNGRRRGNESSDRRRAVQRRQPFAGRARNDRRVRAALRFFRSRPRRTRSPRSMPDTIAFRSRAFRSLPIRAKRFRSRCRRASSRLLALLRVLRSVRCDREPAPTSIRSVRA